MLKKKKQKPDFYEDQTYHSTRNRKEIIQTWKETTEGTSSTRENKDISKGKYIGLKGSFLSCIATYLQKTSDFSKQT